jgi:hypothetical protein
MSEPTKEQRAAAGDVAKMLAVSMRENAKTQIAAGVVKMVLDTVGRRRAVDKWIKQQNDPSLDPMEAIRRLVDLGLKAKAPSSRNND